MGATLAQTSLETPGCCIQPIGLGTNTNLQVRVLSVDLCSALQMLSSTCLSCASFQPANPNCLPTSPVINMTKALKLQAKNQGGQVAKVLLHNWMQVNITRQPMPLMDTPRPIALRPTVGRLQKLYICLIWHMHCSSTGIQLCPGAFL